MDRNINIFALVTLIIIPLAMCSKSFTLVLDTTESMDNEIEILKNNLKITLEGITSNYENFALIHFNDPVVSEAQNFPTLDAFTNALTKIKASNGKDCPEDSVLGIERALENSNRDSLVFVYTDAYAKEGDNAQNIIDLCRNKNVQINIFLTGRCVKTTWSAAGDVNVYYDITRSCSGNVFRLIPSNLTQTFSFIKEMINADWTDIRPEEPFTGDKEIKLAVEPYTTGLMIAISGDYLRTEIQSELEAFNHERIMDGRQIIVDRYLRPEQGEYHIIVSGRDTLVTVYKQVQFPFKYAFTPRNPIVGQFAETTPQPIPAVPTYIVIEVLNTTKMSSIEILWTTSGEKKYLDLEPVLGTERMYISQGYVEANGPFKISVQGYDTLKSIAVTGSTRIIEPQKVSAVTPSVPSRVEIIQPLSNFVDYKGNTTVACKVLAHPQPTIQWDIDGETLPSKDYLLELSSQYLSYASIENFRKNSSVTCKAKNSGGDDYRTIDLFVNRTLEFEIIQSPQDQTIEFGEKERIHCVVLAYPEATKKWYHNDTEIDETYDHYEINPEYLLIKNMSLDDVGTYICVVANEFKSETLSADITISGLDVPEISVSKNELVLSPGSWTEIECKLEKGLPAPILSWTYKSDQDYLFSSLPEGVYENVHKLKIPDVKKSHSGTYRCKAENFLAADEKDVVLKVHYAPIIKTEHESLTVREGDIVNLKCEVDAQPEPEIKWEISRSNQIIPMKSKHKPDQFNTLTFKTDMDDSGDYNCYAKNKVGENMRTISLTVLVPPYIETPPSRFVNASFGSSISLQCHVLRGNPEPTITWNFIAIDSKHTVLKKETQTSVVELKRISKQHEGLYICVAENIVGTDRIRIEVKVT